MKAYLTLLFATVFGVVVNAQTLQFAFPLRNDWRPENPVLTNVYPAKSYGSVQDSEGNQYVYGTIKDTTDIDPGPDSILLLQPYPSLYFGLAPFPKAYIIKYSPTNEIVWVRTLIGYYEIGQIAIDNNQDIIVTGSWGYIFYTEFGGIESKIFAENNPSSFGFMLKINKMGQIIRSKRFFTTLSQSDIIYSNVSAITCDRDGNYYVGGYFRTGTNFGDSLNPVTTSGVRYDDAFYAKYDSDFNLQWVKGFGSKWHDYITKIDFCRKTQTLLISADFGDTLKLSSNGDSILLFPGPSPSIPARTIGGGPLNGLILKTDLSGTVIKHKQIHSDNQGFGYAVEDEFGNIYFSTISILKIIINGVTYDGGTATPPGDHQLLIIAMDSSFSYRWHLLTSSLGSNTKPFGTVIDEAGNLLVSGQFSNVKNFAIAGQPVVNLAAINYQNSQTLTDGFLAKYTKTGRLLWARKLGADGFDEINSVRLDSLNNIYLTGKFEGPGSLNLINPSLNRVTTNTSLGPQGYVTVSNGFFGKYSQCITRTQIRDTICAGTTKAFDGETLRKSGKYVRLKSYNSANQCEVWEELYLHVRPVIPASAGADATICSGKSQQLGSDSIAGLNYNWQQIGGTFTSTQARPRRSYPNFTDTVQRYRFALLVTDAKGCQKRDTITLLVTPVLRDTLTQAICPGENFLGYDTAGTYKDTLVSSLGCDSIRTLTLSIKPKRTFSQTIRLCKNQSLQVGSRIYTQPGLYLDTLTAANGCDSLITSTLSYDIPNDTILLSAQFGALAAPDQDSYQWLDCNAGFAPVVGETDSSFAPSTSGSYAVRVTKGNCADTSNCIFITHTAKTISPASALEVFPNPNTGKATVRWRWGKPGERLMLNTLEGKWVKTLVMNADKQATISGLSPGVYVVQPEAGGAKPVRVMVE